MKNLTVCLFLALAAPTLSAGVNEDWAALLVLDKGPKKKPSSAAEAQLLARNHFLLHQRALEDFLRKYPSDPRAFDARLKLAAIWAAEGKMDGETSKVNRALRLLTELESSPTAPGEKRANAAFQKASLILQSTEGSSARRRETVVATAKNFWNKYPADRRGPRLLVEAATLCDDVPAEKRQLLEAALRETREEALKRRISDDLRRLDHLGRPLELDLQTADRKPFKLSSLRGKPTVLIFWAAESPHSLLWLRDFLRAYEQLPKNQFQVVLVSLDTKASDFTDRLRELKTQWPAHFDGKGWESPVARQLGINALPSVWILDKKGVVRTINATSSYQTWLRELTQE